MATRSRPGPVRAAALLLAAALAACSEEPGPRRPSVLLVTVDTLRADHLDAWGDTRVDTPALDALAREALVFERAWTPVPITTPSLASLLSSRLPRNHGALNNTYDLDASEVTLAEILAEEGYATGAFLPSFLGDKPGFRQGFETYDTPTLKDPLRTGPQVVGRALEWLGRMEAKGDRPWFCWVHLMEPHSPYSPGPELERKYLPPGVLRVPEGLREEVFGEPVERSPEEVEVLRALYRGEVEATDRALAPLLDWAGERGEVLTVFTADHGEVLYEHERYVGHTAWLFEEQLRVPLLFHFTSGRSAGERTDLPASLLDVAPSVLGVLGISFESPGGGLDLLAAEPGVERVLVHETFAPEGHYDQQALREGSRKLHLPSERPGSRPRLFDLARDPGETRDLAGEEPAERLRLEELFHGWAARQRDPDQARRPDVDEAMREKLEDLGYLQATRGGARH